MKYLLLILLSLSSISFAGDKKPPASTEPTVEISVRTLKLIMQLAKDQKQIIENLQEELEDTRKDLAELENKCTF